MHACVRRVVRVEAVRRGWLITPVGGYVAVPTYRSYGYISIVSISVTNLESDALRPNSALVQAMQHVLAVAALAWNAAMHRAFCEFASQYASYYYYYYYYASQGHTVLEVGGMDINGSPRTI